MLPSQHHYSERQRPWVKVCGVTRAEDLQNAEALGVDAVGLVFVPQSPRYVEMAQAIRLSQHAQGALARVGLFMDAPSEQVANVLEHVELDALQFHGGEDPAFCERFGLPYIKALGMGGLSVSDGADKKQAWLEGALRFDSAEALLLDSHPSGEMGGSGQVGDWAVVAELIEGLNRPWILAGGLTPDNVPQALAALHPPGIDLSSGVESQLGIKDRHKMAQLMDALTLKAQRS